LDRNHEAHPGFDEPAGLAAPEPAARETAPPTAAALLAGAVPPLSERAHGETSYRPRDWENEARSWRLMPPQPPRHRRRNLLIAAQTLGFGVMIYLCMFNLSVVRGSSMTPHIHDGDRILIDHFSYMFGSVTRGDIVVLKYPLDPSVDYIKRIIGLPGDDVVLENGHVSVNGRQLEEPYIAEQDQLAHAHVRVAPAHFFVLGDNRPRSCDSREFGLVPQDYVRGKVEVRVWPPDRFGRVDA
jgi:signal peptidase I